MTNGWLSRTACRFVTGCSMIVAMAILPSRGLTEEPPVHWLADFQAAQELAKEKQRPLLVAITATWCGPCRQMRQLTFTDGRIQQLVESKIVAVAVDADQYPSVVTSLGITAYPTTILFDAAGNRRKTWTGFQRANEFAVELEQLSGAGQPSAERDPFAPVSALYPQNSSPVAFGGYCLVSLLDDNKLRHGLHEFRLEYRGEKLSFQSEAHKQRFLANPERYWPVANGVCPVTAQPGDPRVGVRWKGRLWFFSDRDRQQQFIRSPDRFSRNSI